MIKSVELPKYFGINERTIRKWLTRGYLTGVKRNGAWYVSEVDLLYFMSKEPKYAQAIIKLFQDKDIKFKAPRKRN